MPSPISLAPITRQSTAMITALLRAIQPRRPSRMCCERSPSASARTTGTPTPTVPITAKTVVLDAETIPFVDVTAAEMLRALSEDLERRGVRLLIARDIGQVRDVLGGETQRVYPTVEAAVTQAR